MIYTLVEVVVSIYQAWGGGAGQLLPGRYIMSGGMYCQY